MKKKLLIITGCLSICVVAVFNIYKEIEVKVQNPDGTWSVEFRTTTVRGLENTCKNKKDETCKAFACYAN